jgi:hypothetical protein
MIFSEQLDLIQLAVQARCYEWIETMFKAPSVYVRSSPPRQQPSRPLWQGPTERLRCARAVHGWPRPPPPPAPPPPRSPAAATCPGVSIRTFVTRTGVT